GNERFVRALEASGAPLSEQVVAMGIRLPDAKSRRGRRRKSEQAAQGSLHHRRRRSWRIVRLGRVVTASGASAPCSIQAMWSTLLRAFDASVVWQLVVTFFGVLAAALLAWWIERRQTAEERRQRAKRLTRVLVEGLRRNILVLCRMRDILHGDAKN